MITMVNVCAVLWWMFSNVGDIISTVGGGSDQYTDASGCSVFLGYHQYGGDAEWLDHGSRVRNHLQTCHEVLGEN